MIYSYRGKCPRISPLAYISPEATIIGDVEIGPDCYVGPHAVIRADECPIVIGEGTAVEDAVVIHVGGSGSTSCIIGKRVTIGHGAIVHADCVEDNANIGMGAILSLRSRVGSYAVVAEGAVVKRFAAVPARTVVAGIPAKAVRRLEERDIADWDKTKAGYISIARSCLAGDIQPIE